MHAQAGAPLGAYPYALGASLNAELVAFVKLSVTAHIALVTGGASSRTRSLVEDVAVAVLLIQVLSFWLAGPVVVALSLALFASWLVSPQRARAAKLLK
mmetsp:Transcript_485/g.1232  ORF Transcript_485/g.1232 Transcript_485/m.1232 type:complete len:99 (+) Transcript_485:2-298(+)